MALSFSFISHSIGALAFALLALYILSRYLRRVTDKALFVASAASAAWMTILAFQSLYHEIPFYVRYVAELTRNAAWFGVMFALLGIHYLPNPALGKPRFVTSASIMLFVSFLVIITLAEGLTGNDYVSGSTMLILQVAVSLVGLLLLEQTWRNAHAYSRSGIKYLTIGIASLFGYDFFMYTDALLFQHLSTPLWETRGAINALAAPFIALTMINSRKQPIGMHVSRQMVFHTTTLVIAGVYLLFISAGGYYISLFGGTWGEALRVLFIFAGLLMLVVLISSPAIRARIMVFISKNFFDYKYDYRDEWIKSTNALRNTSDQNPLPLQSIRVLGELVRCQQGAIWSMNEDGHFSPKARLNLKDPKLENIDANSDLALFCDTTDWIINLHEYMLDPTKYNLIEIPECILKQEDPWLIIPLRMNERLVGMVLLCQPIADLDLNWENYDLLRIVAQQACSYLEQSDSQEKLAEARQFEAVSKTSAFLIHDIKTIIAQLSLLVKNAERHKQNPAFVDDMIRTTQHTVEKMDHLLKQIRNPEREEQSDNVELGEVLLEVYQEHKASSPVPILEAPDRRIWIEGSRDQIKSAIGHIVQNAIDATDKEGEVSIATKTTSDAAFIFIQDNGVGMSEEYMNEQLFKPFKSTKGLTGMGIGVYQSREYVRKIGGSISVTSQLGVGTCFTIKLPVHKIER